MPGAPILLIVDDDPANHAVAGAALANAGWRIDRADDGAAAIAMSHSRRYTLILMDIQMPGLDGYDTAKAIRVGGGASATAPILAFTATQQIGATTAFRASGIDGHVAKPFTPATLRASIERWRPITTAVPSTALVAAFGAVEIAKLLSGFRDQLERQLDRDDGEERYTGAHRLAGIAGTLGFPEVSRLWLAVSEGDDTAYAEARISARKALAEIDANPMVTKPNQPLDVSR